MERLIKVVAVLVVGTQTVGCVWTTPSGIKEMSRAMNGAVVSGKASPNVEDSYHKNDRIRITLGGSNDRDQ